MNSSHVPEDVPGLEGPDYVALVIEWADDEDTATMSEGTLDPISGGRSSGSEMIRTIAAIVGTLGALVLATWGLRRLRSVS